MTISVAYNHAFPWVEDRIRAMRIRGVPIDSTLPLGPVFRPEGPLGIVEMRLYFPSGSLTQAEGGAVHIVYIPIETLRFSHILGRHIRVPQGRESLRDVVSLLQNVLYGCRCRLTGDFYRDKERAIIRVASFVDVQPYPDQKRDTPVEDHPVGRLALRSLPYDGSVCVGDSAWAGEPLYTFCHESCGQGTQSTFQARIQYDTCSVRGVEEEEDMRIVVDRMLQNGTGVAMAEVEMRRGTVWAIRDTTFHAQ